MERILSNKAGAAGFGSCSGWTNTGPPVPRYPGSGAPCQSSIRRQISSTDSYPHAGSPVSDAKKSQSLLWPRAQTIALMLDPPPSTFPMPRGMARPLRCGFGAAWNCQYLSLPIFVTHWSASVTVGTSSSPPAYSNRTLTAGFSARRLTTTDPAEPDPQIMKSYCAYRFDLSFL